MIKRIIRRKPEPEPEAEAAPVVNASGFPKPIPEDKLPGILVDGMWLQSRSGAQHQLREYGTDAEGGQLWKLFHPRFSVLGHGVFNRLELVKAGCEQCDGYTGPIYRRPSEEAAEDGDGGPLIDLNEEPPGDVEMPTSEEPPEEPPEEPAETTPPPPPKRRIIRRPADKQKVRRIIRRAAK
jgi:hypothetical protein